MKRGRLLLVVGVIGGLAVMAQIGQDGRRATPTTQTIASPPTPLLEERGASATITPLEADVRGLVGVRGVRSVVSVDGIVYMEVDVLQGYAAQPFAEALLGLAQAAGTVVDFSVMLNDGVSVPTSFLWRDGAWNGVQMIQQATLVSATQPPISVPTWTLLPPTQAPMVSPYTCNGVDDVNCGDFNGQWGQAQAHMEMCGDEDNLDGDGDGRACE